jgi:hypothetical protein
MNKGSTENEFNRVIKTREREREREKDKEKERSKKWNKKEVSVK